MNIKLEVLKVYNRVIKIYVFVCNDVDVQTVILRNVSVLGQKRETLEKIIHTLLEKIIP